MEEEDQSKYPIAVILDLDGTLISEVASIYDSTFLRPGAVQLINWLFENFETVGIWTAATKWWFEEQYRTHFEPIITRPFHLTWFVERCVEVSRGEAFMLDAMPGRVKIKPLVKIVESPFGKERGITLKNILIVDDTTQTYERNYGNAIPVKRYYGEPDDIELELVKMEILKKVMKHRIYGTVRPVGL